MRRSARIPSLRCAAVACASALAVGCAAVSPQRAPAPDAGPARRGPIPARSNGPLAQTFLTLRPRGVATAAPGRAELRILSAYSSIYEVGHGPAGAVSFDGELWRTSAMLRTGLGAATDLEIELPVLYASSGFLDVFVETWHAALGLPNSGRDSRPQFDYDMRVTAGSEEAYALTEDRVGIGDVPIVLTRRVLDPRGSAPGVYVQAAVELPTGSEADGFGNGEIDWALGVGLEASVGDWTLGGGAGWTDRRSSTDFAAAGLEVDDGFAVHADAEWRWVPGSSVLAGLRYENAVSPSLGIEELGGDVLELDLGFALDGAGRSRWIVGFSEDLIAESGPDFTALLGFETGF